MKGMMLITYLNNVNMFGYMLRTFLNHIFICEILAKRDTFFDHITL